MPPPAPRDPGPSPPLNPSAAAARYSQALQGLKEALGAQLEMYFSSLDRLCRSLSSRARALEEGARASGDARAQGAALAQRALCLRTREELGCVLADLRHAFRRLPGLRLLEAVDAYAAETASLLCEASRHIEGLGGLVDQAAWEDAARDLGRCLEDFQKGCRGMDLGLPEIDLARRQIAVWRAEMARLGAEAGRAREDSWQFGPEDLQKRCTKEKLERDCLDQISELSDAIRALSEKYGLCV